MLYSFSHKANPAGNRASSIALSGQIVVFAVVEATGFASFIK